MTLEASVKLDEILKATNGRDPLELIDSLPKTKDGYPVTFGEEVWGLYPDDNKIGTHFVSYLYRNEYPISDCYFHRHNAEAALKELKDK